MIDHARNIGSGYRSPVGGLNEKALDVAAAARERLGIGREALRVFVTQRPAMALGLAVGLGVFLGWLIKRR